MAAAHVNAGGAANTRLSGRRRRWVTVAAALTVTGGVGAYWAVDYTPAALDAGSARAALLRTYRHDFGPTTYPVRELESGPLAETPGGWASGGWRVYTATSRYEYVPPGPNMLHFQTGGQFRWSWVRGWMAEADMWVSVTYPSRGRE
jgi:hypothetical protein